MPFFLFRRIFTENAGRFPHPGVFSDETRAVLLVTAYFPQKRGAFSSTRRIFRQNVRRFACHGAFSAKTRGVFLAPKRFPRKRAAFCSSRRVFRQNARWGDCGYRSLTGTGFVSAFVSKSSSCWRLSSWHIGTMYSFGSEVSRFPSLSHFHTCAPSVAVSPQPNTQQARTLSLGYPKYFLYFASHPLPLSPCAFFIRIYKSSYARYSFGL